MEWVIGRMVAFFCSPFCKKKSVNFVWIGTTSIFQAFIQVQIIYYSVQWEVLGADMHSLKEKNISIQIPFWSTVGHCSQLPQHTVNGVLDVHARALSHMLRRNPVSKAQNKLWCLHWICMNEALHVPDAYVPSTSSIFIIINCYLLQD